eukprot:7108542-Alexandrium_andersonii.AAC.1
MQHVGVGCSLASVRITWIGPPASLLSHPPRRSNEPMRGRWGPHRIQTHAVKRDVGRAAFNRVE